ncbi:hypothetical protein C6A85_03685, partial [Mycobacterium sp. ITM-2017-0098]
PAGSQLVDLLDGRDAFPLDDHGRIELQLGPYGYRWLRLLRPGAGVMAGKHGLSCASRVLQYPSDDRDIAGP